MTTFDPAAGPWFIRSHYWGRWHRRGDDGRAGGYTDDIAAAGVFDLDRARAYHEEPSPQRRDEAIPCSRLVAEMEERLAQMDRDRAAFAAKIDAVRTAVAA